MAAYHPTLRPGLSLNDAKSIVILPALRNEGSEGAAYPTKDPSSAPALHVVIPFTLTEEGNPAPTISVGDGGEGPAVAVAPAILPLTLPS